MKKILFALSLVGMFAIAQKSFAEWGDKSSLVAGSDADNYTYISLSSGAIYSGAGRVKQVYLSSGTGGLDWCQLLSTVQVSMGGTYYGYTSTNIVSVPVSFTTTTFVGANMNGNMNFGGNNGMYFGENGIRINDAFLYKTAGGSGGANLAVIRWSR